MRETAEARGVVRGGGTLYAPVDWAEEGKRPTNLLKAAQDRVIRQHNRIVELQQENERLRIMLKAVVDTYIGAEALREFVEGRKDRRMKIGEV